MTTYDTTAAQLTGSLTDEYGHLVPPGLIATTVETVTSPPLAVRDPQVAEATARADVAALAEAVRRATAEAAS